MAVVSAAAMASALAAAGVPTAAIPIGVAIGFAESGGNTTATHQNSDAHASVDYGVWQINGYWHPELFSRYKWSDLNDNAKMAAIVYEQADNSWSPWSTFKGGQYQKFMGTASAASSGVTSSGATGAASGATVDATALGLVDNTSAALTALNDFFTVLSSPDMWRRIAIGLAGVLLVVAGVIVVFRRPISTVAKTAALV